MVRRNSQEECMVRRNGRPFWPLMLAALAALTALVFELFIAGRKPEALKVVQKIAA